jgi:hypothetical protein
MLIDTLSIRCIIIIKIPVDYIMKKPPLIFRFQPISTRTLQNLLRRVVYFSPPIDVNDPFDCAIGGRFVIPKKERFEKVRRSFSKSKDLDEEAKDLLRTAPIEIFADRLLETGSQLVLEERDKFRLNGGLVCFTEKHENTLMWSHYANNCKGICLEFSTEFFPFNEIEKVKYRDQFPFIYIHNAFSGSSRTVEIKKFFLTKSSHWKYEREWRLLHDKAYDQIPYDPGALKAVYFGSETEMPQIGLVGSILKSTNQKVRFFRGRKSNTDFKMIFDEFDFLDSNVANSIRNSVFKK